MASYLSVLSIYQCVACVSSAFVVVMW